MHFGAKVRTFIDTEWHTLGRDDQSQPKGWFQSMWQGTFNVKPNLLICGALSFSDSIFAEVPGLNDSNIRLSSHTWQVICWHRLLSQVFKTTRRLDCIQNASEHFLCIYEICSSPVILASTQQVNDTNNKTHNLFALQNPEYSGGIKLRKLMNCFYLWIQ